MPKVILNNEELEKLEKAMHVFCNKQRELSKAAGNKYCSIGCPLSRGDPLWQCLLGSVRTQIVNMRDAYGDEN